MYRIYFGFLVAIFCSRVSVFANTIENPPNAYLIDHRGVPQTVVTMKVETETNQNREIWAVNTQWWSSFQISKVAPHKYWYLIEK